jgi:hypothetical protein
MSGRPSESMEEFDSQWTDFHSIDIWIFFSKISPEDSSFIKADKNKGYFTQKPIYVYDHVSRNPS